MRRIKSYIQTIIDDAQSAMGAVEFSDFEDALSDLKAVKDDAEFAAGVIENLPQMAQKSKQSRSVTELCAKKSIAKWFGRAKRTVGPGGGVKESTTRYNRISAPEMSSQ